MKLDELKAQANEFKINYTDNTRLSLSLNVTKSYWLDDDWLIVKLHITQVRIVWIKVGP